MGHWTRISYGVIAKKIKTTCLADDHLTHVIKIDLPLLRDVKSATDELTGEPCDAFCLRLRGVANTIRQLVVSMQDSVTGLINRINAMIPDLMKGTVKRQPRALFDFLGLGAHYLMGVATDASIEELKKMIADVKLQSQTAVGDSTRTRSSVVEFTRIAYARFDSLHTILNEERKSISSITQQVRAMSEVHYAWVRMLTVGIEELSRFVEIHDSVYSLETAIEKLIRHMSCII